MNIESTIYMNGTDKHYLHPFINIFTTNQNNRMEIHKRIEQKYSPSSLTAYVYM